MGTAYVRLGAQSLPVVDPERLRRLEYAKGIRSFETHPVDVPLEIVTNSETIIGFVMEVVPTGAVEPWLRKQLLVRDGKPDGGRRFSSSLTSRKSLFLSSRSKGLSVCDYGFGGHTRDLAGSTDDDRREPLRRDRSAVRAAVEMVEGIRVMGRRGWRPSHIRKWPSTRSSRTRFYTGTTASRTIFTFECSTIGWRSRVRSPSGPHYAGEHS